MVLSRSNVLFVVVTCSVTRIFATSDIVPCGQGLFGGKGGLNASDNESSRSAEDNPFLNGSEPLSFSAPKFDLIREEHFMPAVLAGIEQQTAEVLAISNSSEEPSFENTVAALERSGSLLDSVFRVFRILINTKVTDELEKIRIEVLSTISNHYYTIMFNPDLFKKVEAVYNAQDTAGLDEEQRRVLKKYYGRFINSGARLSSEQQQRLKQNKERQAVVKSEFRKLVLEISKERGVVINSVEELDGLSKEEILLAKSKATERGLTEKYLLSITNTTRVPLLASLKNRETRRRLWLASVNRGLGENGGIDLGPTVLEIARLHAEEAQIMGYSNYGEFVLRTEMARTPQAARELLGKLSEGVLAKVKMESSLLESEIKKQGLNHRLEAWDWEFYAQRVRESQFEFDESSIKPYFELNRVVEKGVFFTMERLYGIKFRERKDLPVYHPDVRVYDVVDSSGDEIALFYTDYYKRDRKVEGARMLSLQTQSKLLSRMPVIVNVLNIQKGTEGQPTLIGLDTAKTLFHEMGHALHEFFSNVTYPGVAGSDTPTDFAEFPSTVHEDWSIHPEVLANYAKHYETDEPLPPELLRRYVAAQSFNKGFDTFEMLAAATLDLEWHALALEEIPSDVEDFERQVLQKMNMSISTVPPRYRSSYFSHIWAGAYASRFYSYVWSDLIAADAFQYFQENGGLSREMGEKFREHVLSIGASVEPMTAFKNFRGQEPSINGLLIRRGLK